MKKFIPAALLVAVLCSAQLFAIVYANHSCIIYDACPPDGESIKSGNSLINTLIIDGAGYFLKSNSNYIMLLNGVEVSELYGADTPQWQTAFYGAWENMEKASATYEALISTARETPYNPAVLEKLTTFDFKTFVKAKKLNTAIFSRIEGFLKKGNVTGVYVLLKSDMDNILLRLKSLKAVIDAGGTPGISQLLELNQVYCYSMLTGQYLSQVFKAI